MSSIKIKNFGPIKEGFTANDGFLPIDKLMLFIGGQGSGKSSIVKLISTLTWLEKAFCKKQLSIEKALNNDFFSQELFEYQAIKNYFKPNTYIEYKGEYIHFKYNNSLVEINYIENESYEVPKITYIPAERNFLSVLEELENVKNVPKSLSWTLEEYTKACRSLLRPISIYINDIKFEYNKTNKTASISGEGFDYLKLSEASSGIQSVVPMIVVLSYLDHFINAPKINSIDKLSLSERETLEDMQNEFALNSSLTQEEFQFGMDKIIKKFLPQSLFTIIEEIEQNLFPKSQKDILYKTFEFNNEIIDNHLIITTHSPYIIAYTSLAMKAFMVKEKAKNNKELITKIESVVPIKSCVNPEETGVYQIDSVGAVISIKSERGLIFDNNFLNDSLENTNDMFSELLDIEELC